jgi:hydrogenase maturation protease
MNPMNVLKMVKSLGGTPGRVLIVGCEPGGCEPDDLGSDDDGLLGLSEPVEAAVDEAIALIESLVSKVLEGEPVV